MEEGGEVVVDAHLGVGEQDVELGSVDGGGGGLGGGGGSARRRVLGWEDGQVAALKR